MFDYPEEVGRKYKPFDLYGWIMCILGLLLMCHFSGIGWIFGTEKTLHLLALTIFIFFDFMIRVAYGRVYRLVYYDTIIHPLYEIKIDDKVFFVNAPNEEHLKIYMDLNYPAIEKYTIVETHTETYIRTEKYL